jgi:cell division protein ZapE
VRDVNTVLSTLAAQIEAHKLLPDPQQLECARQLDAVRAALQTSRGGGLLSSLRLPWTAPPAIPPVRGLYIWGGVGRGKTCLMDLFYDSLNFKERERSHFYRFMRDIHAQLHALKDVEDPLEQVALDISQRIRVLCFDELFVSDIGDAMILGTLFDALFRRGVTLVATSNVPPDELYEGGLQRQRFLPAIDLLKRHLDVLHLDGGVDYRLRHLQQSGTYLDAAASGTTPRMKQLFLDLNGHAGSGPRAVQVEGRSIDAVDTSPDTIWFDFAALCEGPRSQNDYIDLAHDYHTVFVSGVPVFDTTREDAARRFIMLVDEFYDRGVKLVLSAAAPPSELYRGERLRFEFERAASRLIEMQSGDYLAQQHRA